MENGRGVNKSHQNWNATPWRQRTILVRRRKREKPSGMLASFFGVYFFTADQVEESDDARQGKSLATRKRARRAGLGVRSTGKIWGWEKKMRSEILRSLTREHERKAAFTTSRMKLSVRDDTIHSRGRSGNGIKD